MANLSNLPYVPTYFVEKRFSGETAAIFSVVLAVFLPLIWFNSHEGAQWEG